MPSTALETARAAAAAPPVHEPRELSYLRIVAQGLVPATPTPPSPGPGPVSYTQLTLPTTEKV